MLTTSLLLLSVALGQARCVTTAGQTQCAFTELGACASAYGTARCFDPSPEVQQLWPDAEPAQCKAAYDTIACGYACVAAYGQVRCAQTPAGVCQAAYGAVACFDPPLFVRVHWPDAEGPKCLAAYGSIACGYNCTAAYGQVRCAQTPVGVCQAVDGRVQCFDPGRRRVRRHR